MSKKIVFDYGNIFIESQNFNKAFKSLKKALLEEHSQREGNENRLLWINIEKIKESTELESLLYACQWYPEFDLYGNIDTIKSRINLIGEDKLIFKTLAPYVEDGSMLIMFAEDERTFYKEHRYIFKNKKMHHYCSEMVEDCTK